MSSSVSGGNVFAKVSVGSQQGCHAYCLICVASYNHFHLLFLLIQGQQWAGEESLPSWESLHQNLPMDEGAGVFIHHAH